MIEVNERWGIAVNDKCYMPCRRSKNGHYGRAECYVNELSTALEYVAKKDVLTALSGIDVSLGEAITIIDRINREYRKEYERIAKYMEVLNGANNDFRHPE